MRNRAVVLTCAFLAVATGCHRGPAANPAVISTFQAITDLLDRLAAVPASVVPDAVLNRARCVIVIPASSARTAPGAASCRDASDHWEPPALVQYDADRRLPGDTLIFLLSERSVREWQSGALDLHRLARAGPALEKVITVTDADLAADALSYVQTQSGLAGRAVSGTIALTQAAAEIASAEPPSARQVVGAVTSFFNTITPIGIILHHSAVIPGDEKVPTSAGEVDEFHRVRGFDILCQGREYHVAYHYLVLADGTVKTGRPERCQGAHAKGYNAYLGIALVGDFSSTDNPGGDKGPTAPTAQQMQALTALCRKLMARYSVPLQRVMRHNDVASTRCPGDRFPFAELLSALQGRP